MHSSIIATLEAAEVDSSIPESKKSATDLDPTKSCGDLDGIQLQHRECLDGGVTARLDVPQQDVPPAGDREEL